MSERQTHPYDFSRFRDPRFQPIPGYEDIQRAPQAVMFQTDLLLRLYRTRAVQQPEITREYFQNYTLRFLDKAAQGAERAFTKDEAVINAQPLDVNEAADVTKIVFAWMHYFAASQFLPNGFSRRGMLQAPATIKQFLQRTAEIKRELALVVAEIRDPDMPLEAKPSALRAHAFFHVGAVMPLKFPDNERELAEREKDAFNKLLGDISIDLP